MNVPKMPTLMELLTGMHRDAEQADPEPAFKRSSKYSSHAFTGGIRESDVGVDVREMGDSISIHGTRAGHLYLYEETHDLSR